MCVHIRRTDHPCPSELNFTIPAIDFLIKKLVVYFLFMSYINISILSNFIQKVANVLIFGDDHLFMKRVSDIVNKNHKNVSKL